MSALRYKSKIDVPAVDLPNGVELTSPNGGRIAAKGIYKSSENHTRDNDLINFGHFVKCTIEMDEDSIIDGATAENLNVDFNNVKYSALLSEDGQSYYITFDFGVKCKEIITGTVQCNWLASSSTTESLSNIKLNSSKYTYTTPTASRILGSVSSKFTCVLAN